MASRALMARLSTAFSISLGSARTDHSRGASSVDERDRLPQRAAQQLGHRQHLVVEVENDGLEPAAAREGQQPIGQPRAHQRRVVGAGQQVALLVALDFHLEQLEIAGDDRQQVVEIMGDAAGQLADRLHALRLAQRLVLHDLLADVAIEGEEADELAVLVMQRALRPFRPGMPRRTCDETAPP